MERRKRLVKTQSDEKVENVDVYACEVTNYGCNIPSGCDVGNDSLCINPAFCGGGCPGAICINISGCYA